MFPGVSTGLWRTTVMDDGEIEQRAERYEQFSGKAFKERCKEE